MQKVRNGTHIAEEIEAYFAGAGCLCIAWWVGDVGISRPGTRWTIQIYDPLWRRRGLGGWYLFHVEHFIQLNHKWGI